MSAAAIKCTSARRFSPFNYENQCNRCGQTVYSTEKIGPLKDFTFYHNGCFKCALCGTKLTLKTYYNNQQDQDDKEVSSSSSSSSFSFFVLFFHLKFVAFCYFIHLMNQTDHCPVQRHFLLVLM